MINQSYYRVPENTPCNEEIPDQFLVVNCTGICSIQYNFRTRGMRKDYYLLYLCKGSLKVQINGKIQTMNEGQVVIFNPNQEYSYSKSDNDEMYYYWVHFSGFGAEELLAKCGILNKGIIEAGIKGAVIHEFICMFDDFINRDCLFEISAASHLIAICTELGRSVNNVHKNPEPLINSKISASIQYIHANYNKNIKIEDLAKMELLSLSYYRTLFRRYTGLSPRAYIKDLRIKNACDLIMRSNLTLKEISVLVGYKDPFYFSRIFKAHTGIMPSRYKERHK